MAQWYVKDLSKLTGVSVQTLHHYDRIGLLNPSLRLENNYRLYSEKDLLKLQQIIALKFFGFGLTQIKTLLAGNNELSDHFTVQAQFLEEKAKTLLEASQTLKSIIAECGTDKSIPWETIINLIEVYRMTQQLEQTWLNNVLSPEELKQFARFESGLKSRFSKNEVDAFEKAWALLTAEVKENLDQDPYSEFGISIAQRCMDLINHLYGTEHANLRMSIWERGFKKGTMAEDQYVAPEVVAWLDKAIDAYYRGRIFNILEQVEIDATPSLVMQWHALMEEMYGYGDEKQHKQAVIDEAMKESRVGPAARKWLQKLSKS